MNETTTTTIDNVTRERFERIMRETYRFNRRDLAFGFASHATKAQWVMLGDDERYWVTTPANCAALEAMGYEFAS